MADRNSPAEQARSALMKYLTDRFGRNLGQPTRAGTRSEDAEGNEIEPSEVNQAYNDLYTALGRQMGLSTGAGSKSINLSPAMTQMLATAVNSPQLQQYRGVLNPAMEAVTSSGGVVGPTAQQQAGSAEWQSRNSAYNAAGADGRYSAQATAGAAGGPTANSARALDASRSYLTQKYGEGNADLKTTIQALERGFGLTQGGKDITLNASQQAMLQDAAAAPALQQYAPMLQQLNKVVAESGGGVRANIAGGTFQHGTPLSQGTPIPGTPGYDAWLKQVGGQQAAADFSAAGAAQRAGPRYSKRADGTIYDQQSGAVWSENMAPQDVLDAVYGAGAKTSTRPYNAATLPGETAPTVVDGRVQENVMGNPTQAERDLGTKSTIPGFNLPPYGTPGHPLYQGPGPQMGPGGQPSAPPPGAQPPGGWGGQVPGQNLPPGQVPGQWALPRMYSPQYVDTQGSASNMFGTYMGQNTMQQPGFQPPYQGQGMQPQPGYGPQPQPQFQQSPMNSNQVQPQMSAGQGMSIRPEFQQMGPADRSQVTPEQWAIQQGWTTPGAQQPQQQRGQEVSPGVFVTYDSRGTPSYTNAQGQSLRGGMMLSATGGTGGAGLPVVPPGPRAEGEIPPDPGPGPDGVPPVYNPATGQWEAPAGPKPATPAAPAAGGAGDPAYPGLGPRPTTQVPGQQPVPIRVGNDPMDGTPIYGWGWEADPNAPKPAATRGAQYPSEEKLDMAQIAQIMKGMNLTDAQIAQMTALLPGMVNIQTATIDQVYAGIQNAAGRLGLDIDKFQFEKGVEQAKVTGRYGDDYSMDWIKTFGYGPGNNPTLDTNKFLHQQEIDRGNLALTAELGYAGSRRADAQVGFQEAGVTGYYNNNPTMQREQLISDTERANLLAQAQMGNMAAQIRLKEVDQAENQRQFNVGQEMQWRQNPTSVYDRVWGARTGTSGNPITGGSASPGAGGFATPGAAGGGGPMAQGQSTVPTSAGGAPGGGFAPPAQGQASGALTYNEIRQAGAEAPGIAAATSGARPGVMPSYQNAGGMPTVSGQALNQLSPTERGVFDAQLRVTGNDPQDYEWNRRRLMGQAAGSGAGFAAPRRY